MKQKRHEEIIRIISSRDIATQEELQAELKKAGFDVTQATISRDIRRLRLVKRQSADRKNVYMMPSDGAAEQQERPLRVLRDCVRSAEPAQNILVIKTDAGMAMGAAAAIDALSMEGVVGCIAGDDTILVVMKTAEAAEEACRKLRKNLYDAENKRKEL